MDQVHGDWPGAFTFAPGSCVKVVVRLVKPARSLNRTNVSDQAVIYRLPCLADQGIVTTMVTHEQRDVPVVRHLDKGVGFDVEAAGTGGCGGRAGGGGFGLFSIGERLTWIGGRMTIQSGKAGRTVIRMTVPVTDAEKTA